MNKLFLLGCGAQEAGTSWIHDHLAARPEADFGELKEEAVDEQTAATVARYYRPVYEMAAGRFGREAMEARWSSYEYL